MANAIRALAMDGVQKANSGHPPMPRLADAESEPPDWLGVGESRTQLLNFEPGSPCDA